MHTSQRHLTATPVTSVTFENVAMFLLTAGGILFVLAALLNVGAGALLGFVMLFFGVLMLRETIWDNIPKEKRETVIRHLYSME